MSQALIIDKTTVTTVVKDLHERFNLARVVFVGDRGMLSDANLEMILGAEAGFIVVELKNRISHRGKVRYLEELGGKPLQ
jgi:transposase